MTDDKVHLIFKKEIVYVSGSDSYSITRKLLFHTRESWLSKKIAEKAMDGLLDDWARCHNPIRFVATTDKITYWTKEEITKLKEYKAKGLNSTSEAEVKLRNKLFIKCWKKLWKDNIVTEPYLIIEFPVDLTMPPDGKAHKEGRSIEVQAPPPTKKAVKEEVEEIIEEAEAEISVLETVEESSGE